MMPARQFTRIVTPLVAVLVFVAQAWSQQRSAEQVAKESREFRAAMAAHHICSGLWVVGRSYERTPEEVVAQDIAPFKVFGWEPEFTYQVDHERRTVTVTAPGAPPRIAKYHGDQGSTILPRGEKDVFYQPVTVPRKLPEASKQPWPNGDAGATEPVPRGVDRQAVAAALDWAMEKKEQNTRAFVVAYQGKIVGERYAPGWTKNTPQISWSQGKSITAALIGVLVQRGHLDLDQPAPVKEWQAKGDPRREIRIRDLLRMSSGLDFINLGLNGSPAFTTENEHFRVYFDSLDVFKHAVNQPLKVPPNTRWSYLNSDPLTLGKIIRDTVEAQGEEYLTFPQRALFDRIGARNFVLETDAWGNFILSGYDYGSARDWVRFGLLHLEDGVWQGERILPEGWVKFISTPAPAEPTEKYGGLFWLNRDAKMDRVPKDAYWSAGFMGQVTLVIPSRDLVVVRLGPSPEGFYPYLNEAVGRILEALPEKDAPTKNVPQDDKSGDAPPGELPELEVGKPIRLFDGETLNGWTTQSGEPVTSGWKVEDGAIYRESRGGNIFYAREVGDFELTFEWKITKGGNNGLKYRVHKYGGRTLGCEYQLLGETRPSFNKGSAGSLYALYEPGKNKKLNPPGEWNTARIVAHGPRIEHWMNGERIVEADLTSEQWRKRLVQSKFRSYKDFGRHTVGRIMLTDHGSEVWYRNLVLKPLPTEEIPDIAPDPRPNVIVFLTDDQGTLDANCYGSEDLDTPSIDRIAREGVRFTQAYAHTVCCPARALLLTGRHPQRSGINSWTQRTPTSNDGPNLALDEITIAEALQAEGYRTALFGKWHLGAALTHGPTRQGFDEFFGIRCGFIDNYNHFFLHGDGFHDLYEGTEEHFAEGEFFPDLVVQRAHQFLEEKRDAPFFMYVALNLPHYPEQADARFDEQYREMPMPRRSYAKALSTADARIGQVLAKLDELEIRDNTIIVLMSDNGHSTERYEIQSDDHSSGLEKGTGYGAHGGGGNTGKWRGHKGTFLEGGIRVPAIISLPARLPAGEVRHQAITAADFFPTVLELCQVPLPDVKLDGQTLLPIIESSDASSHHKIMNWQWQEKWAVREGVWKLIFDGRQMHLGNLADENPEEKNYANEQPEIVQRLTSLHEQWVQEVQPHAELPPRPPDRPQAQSGADRDGKQKARERATRKRRPHPAMTKISDDPNLPRVLLIGDSISIGYTVPTRALLKSKANVHRPLTNCGPTTRGLAQIDRWLGEGKWDVIHFNWGLHDLKYLGPNDENLADPKAPTSRQQVPIAQYERNLDKLVTRLSKTGAKLIWRNTTPVPPGANGRVVGDAARYNEAAARVMEMHGVSTHDLYTISKRRMDELMREANVHYTPKGYEVLAKDVARVIEESLSSAAHAPSRR